MAAENNGDKVNKSQVVGAFLKIFEAAKRGRILRGLAEGPPPDMPQADLPQDNFVDRWDKERLLRHLLGHDAKPAEITQLGPYIEAAKAQADQRDAVFKLGQKQHVVAFPENLVLLFASLDQDRIDTLGKMADWSPEIVRTLHRLAQEEIERVIKRGIWIKAWKATAGGAVVAFAVAKWGWEVWLWVSGNFPSAGGWFKWLSGSLK